MDKVYDCGDEHGNGIEQEETKFLLVRSIQDVVFSNACLTLDVSFRLVTMHGWHAQLKYGVVAISTDPERCKWSLPRLFNIVKS